MGGVCNFSEQHNLTKILEVITLDVLCYLCHYEKRNDYENTDLEARLMNVAHSDGSIIDDTEEDIES